MIAIYQQKYNFMTDPFSHPFPLRNSTMYLSTITKVDFKTQQPFVRPSTFLQNDIAGTAPRVLIPQNVNTSNYLLSTYIEPVPDRSKHINKSSDPLFIDDIEGARPKCTEFRSKRMVDPLCPKYLLPTASQIIIDPGRKFLRDTLQIEDINGKRGHNWANRGRQIVKEVVEGSSPSKLTKQVNSIPRLEVKDINKDCIFETNRRTDPLQPTYHWRDDDDKNLNSGYGRINGSQPKRMHPLSVNRANNLCLGIKDIEGTQANSFFAKSHFVDKRREFRNYMVTQDIEKTNSSSLKKGIVTLRQTNPLMPTYQYPGSKAETH